MILLSGGLLVVTAGPAVAQVSPNNQPPPQVGGVVIQQPAVQPAVEGISAERPAPAAAQPAAQPQVLGEQLSRSAPVSTLPFTGGDLMALAASGVALAGAGTVLVRRTRRRA